MEDILDGWLKIHRKLLDWQWFHSSNHLKLFLVLLLKANFKESKWRKEIIAQGQLLTGRKQLSSWSGLSEQQVRTILRDFIDSGEITIKTTNKFSIITITNWQDYQLDDQQVTIKEPTSNHQITTSKKEKKVKNEKKISLSNESLSCSSSTASQSHGERVILRKKELNKDQLSLVYDRNKKGWDKNEGYSAIPDLQSLFPELNIVEEVKKIDDYLAKLDEDKFNKNAPYGFIYIVNCLNRTMDFKRGRK